MRERATVRLIGPRTGHNAALAFGTALALGADPAAAAAGLGAVTSLARRLEPVGARNGVRIFSDYGYKHPVNVRTGLAALRRHFPEARITAVFEPYVGYLAPWGRRYAQALGGADHVILAPPATASDFPDGQAFDARWADGCPVRPVRTGGRQEAVEAGLGFCGPGDVLVLFGMPSALSVMTEHALGQAS
jgi:UDP-N-acetylmuramate--alanine ligase